MKSFLFCLFLFTSLAAQAAPPGWKTLSKEEKTTLKDALSGDTYPEYASPALYAAIKAGDAKSVEKLMALGVDPNKPVAERSDDLPISGLRNMYEVGNFNETVERIISALVKGKVPLDMNHEENQDGLFFTLHGLCERMGRGFDYAGFIQALVRGGLDINLKGTIGRNLLFYVCNEKQVDAIMKEGFKVTPASSNAMFWVKEPECITALARIGLNPNVQYANGKTPLMLAENELIAEALLDAGADPSLKDNDGKTAVELAKNREIANMIMKKGKGFSKEELGQQLFKAESATTLAELLKKGADVTVKDAEGRTIFDWYTRSTSSFYWNRLRYMTLLEQGYADPKAAERGIIGETIAVLSNCGTIEVTHKDKEGNTPLHHAVLGGDILCLKSLLERKADVNAVNAKGQTPICFIAGTRDYYGTRKPIEPGDKEMIKELVKAGADLNKVSSEGFSALHMAALYDEVDIGLALINEGAKGDVANSLGEIPLHKTFSPEMVMLLVSKSGGDQLETNEGLNYHDMLAKSTDSRAKEVRALLDKMARRNPKEAPRGLPEEAAGKELLKPGKYEYVKEVKVIILTGNAPPAFEIRSAEVTTTQPMTKADIIKELVPQDAKRTRPMRTPVGEGLYACSPNCTQLKKITDRYDAQGIKYTLY